MTQEGEEIPRDRYGHRRSGKGQGWAKGLAIGKSFKPPTHECIPYSDGKARFCAICGKRLDDEGSE